MNSRYAFNRSARQRNSSDSSPYNYPLPALWCRSTPSFACDQVLIIHSSLTQCFIILCTITQQYLLTGLFVTWINNFQTLISYCSKITSHHLGFHYSLAPHLCSGAEVFWKEKAKLVSHMTGLWLSLRSYGPPREVGRNLDPGGHPASSTSYRRHRRRRRMENRWWVLSVKCEMCPPRRFEHFSVWAPPSNFSWWNYWLCWAWYNYL